MEHVSATMVSVVDIIGLTHVAATSAASLVIALKQQLSAYQSLSRLLEASELKIERIQLSISSIRNLARISALESHFFVQAFEDVREVETELREIQDSILRISAGSRFLYASTLSEKLNSVLVKLNEIDRQFGVVGMIGDAVSRKIEKECHNLGEKLSRTIGDRMNELSWLLNRALQATVPVQAASSLLGVIRDEDSGITRSLTHCNPEFDLFAEEQKAHVHFLIGRSYYSGDHIDGENRYRSARFLHSAFDGGCTQASYFLGKLYQTGEGVPKSLRKAFEYLSLGAESGDAEAIYELGRCFDFGLGAEIDGKKALGYYNDAASRGCGEALCMAGYHSLHGNSSVRNWSRAVRLLKQARKAGVMRANYHLAYCYEYGIVVEKNASMAFLLAQEAHENGVDIAPFRLAMAYERGLGVECDVFKAAEFYQKMKNVPVLGAIYQSYYGLCLIQGAGVERNTKLGLSIVRKGLKNGHGCGWSVYGDCFRHGYGVKKDIVKAVSCYSKAISSYSGARGVADAHFALAEMYETGRGLEQNSNKAAHHYIHAADRMVQKAQWKAGSFLECGKGVDKHVYRAFFYYDLAARSGHASSQRKAGELYMKGKGIERDRSKAIELLEHAIESGDRDAAKLLNKARRRRFLFWKRSKSS